MFLRDTLRTHREEEVFGLLVVVLLERPTKNYRTPTMHTCLDRRHPNVDPRINKPLFINMGVVPSKSDESPLKPGTPPY